MSFPSDDSSYTTSSTSNTTSSTSYTTSSTSFTIPICDNENNADYTPAEFPRSPSPEFPDDDNDTYNLAPRPPSPEFNHDTAGWVLNPDGTAQFVANRAAHFAQHPEAQASTEADMRVWQAELDRKVHEERVRARGERAWAKILRRDERVREFEGVVHGCVGGWVVGTCGGCAGTGR